MEAEPKLSQHAKRRQKKQQQKKEQADQDIVVNVAKPVHVEKNVEMRSESNQRQEEQKKPENHRMKSESKPSKDRKYKPSKGPSADRPPKESTHYQTNLKPPTFVDKEKVLKSTETGFTGPKQGWFDEDLFKRAKHKVNFDGAKDHDYYFNSYSSHHIHEEMLKDTSRTTAYQRAIENNPEDFKDKIVLDIGCGTGILSLFAAKAGAKHVYAVDNAEIALFAREIVKANGYEDKITVFKGKIEEINFPFKEGEVDIIISEWMGYFLLYESMLDCVIWARDKYLNKKTGKMLPDRAQMYIAAIEDSEYTTDKKSFWNDVYGFDMSIMSSSIFKDPVVDTVPPA